MATSLRRGLGAGLAAGVLAGLFAFLLGEPSIREAIRLEELVAPASGPDTGYSVTRDVQELGLVAATALVGTTIGGIFGLVYTAVRSRVSTASDWLASLQLGVVAYLAVSLLPALKYAPNPPAVGDPATVGSRTAWYLGAIALSVIAALATWLVARWLARSGAPMIKRHLAVGALAVTTVVGVFLLPSNRDPIEIPARLLWDFRLSSYATQLVLWGGLTVVFGLFAARAQRETTA